MLTEFHNINKIEWKFDNTQKETEETYNEKLLQTELSLLDIFTTMTSIIDFNNKDLIKKCQSTEKNLVKDNSLDYSVLIAEVDKNSHFPC